MANMLLPLSLERMFAGALDASSVFANETDRLAYLTNPIAYAGQVVSQADTGEIFVIVKNASGDFEYVGVVGGECKYDISESYETMTAGAKPATNKIYYLMNDYTDDADVTYESGFWLYSVTDDKYIELSFASDTKFTETEGTMVELSGLKAGTIVTGWTDHKVLQAALFPATSPSITSFTPASTVNEIGTEVGVVTLSATIVKKTNPITSVTFYANDIAIETLVTDVANGGVFSKDYNFETNVDIDVVFKVIVSDGILPDATKSVTYSFARNGFYGTSTDATPLSTSDQIRALTPISNIKKGKTFNIQVPIGAKNVIICYPSTLGELASVKFVESMNAEISSVFTKTTIQVEGNNNYSSTEYNCYQYTPSVEFSQVSTFAVTI